MMFANSCKENNSWNVRLALSRIITRLIITKIQPYIIFFLENYIKQLIIYINGRIIGSKSRYVPVMSRK